MSLTSMYEFLARWKIVSLIPSALLRLPFWGAGRLSLKIKAFQMYPVSFSTRETIARKIVYCVGLGLRC